MLVLRLLSEGGGEGPNLELQWLLNIGIALFFLVILAGWWSSSRKKAEPVVEHEPAAHHDAHEHEEPAKAEASAPKAVKGGRKK
jgi:hypothetical protein